MRAQNRADSPHDHGATAGQTRRPSSRWTTRSAASRSAASEAARRKRTGAATAAVSRATLAAISRNQPGVASSRRGAALRQRARASPRHPRQSRVSRPLAAGCHTTGPAWIGGCRYGGRLRGVSAVGTATQPVVLRPLLRVTQQRVRAQDPAEVGVAGAAPVVVGRGRRSVAQVGVVPAYQASEGTRDLRLGGVRFHAEHGVRVDRCHRPAPPSAPRRGPWAWHPRSVPGPRRRRVSGCGQPVLGGDRSRAQASTPRWPSTTCSRTVVGGRSGAGPPSAPTC